MNNMMVLIDNYDSFTYNLVQYFQSLDQTVSVYKNDEIEIKDLIALNPTHIVISPGPKAPEDAGISMKVIQQFYDKTPILGVCLGHQCLAKVFGGHIIGAPEIIHGKTSIIEHNYQRLFQNIPNGFHATRYHSLVVEPETLPTCFALDAWTNQTIMAISHREYPLFGLQFHPEAILSEHGLQILNNFIQY